MTVRFHAAFVAAQRLASELARRVGRRVALVQDVIGRYRFVVDDRDADVDRPDVDAWLTRHAHELGGFDPPGGRLAWTKDLLRPDDLFGGDAIQLESGAVYVDRAAMGADWRRPVLPNRAPAPLRLITYGVKGGVGRSTATAVLAWSLAREGRRVLAVDLDLESPGLGSLLVPTAAHPAAGVVDWLVEQGVGQADSSLLSMMVAEAQFAAPFDTATGSVHVVPAAGRDDLVPSDPAPDAPSVAPSYLDKLSRARLDLPTNEPGVEPTFAGRIGALLDHLEELVRPDVVLVDSRSGLHDIAAVALTRLGGEVLLFAGGSPSTWAAYHLLLHRWATRLDAARRRELLERLHVVAALVPEHGRPAYRETLRAHAYEAFRTTLYAPAAAGEPEEFVRDAVEAPHAPIDVLWHAALGELSFAALHATVAEVEAAFQALVDKVRELVDAQQSGAA